MDTAKKKGIRKANQGETPSPDYKINKGSEPSLGSEGGAPGHYPLNNPRKIEKRGK